jgi:hypothetical protein
MSIWNRRRSRKVSEARAALQPLKIGSRVEVRLSDGEVCKGQLNGLQGSKVMINDHGVSLSRVTDVYHVTSLAHE